MFESFYKNNGTEFPQKTLYIVGLWGMGRYTMKSVTFKSLGHRRMVSGQSD